MESCTGDVGHFASRDQKSSVTLVPIGHTSLGGSVPAAPRLIFCLPTPRLVHQASLDLQLRNLTPPSIALGQSQSPENVLPPRQGRALSLPGHHIGHANPDEQIRQNPATTKHTFHNALIPILLLPPLHANPLPSLANTRQPPLLANHNRNRNRNRLLTPVITPLPEGTLADSIILRKCLPRRAPCDIPSVTTGPKAPPWIPGTQEGQKWT
ncbi:hypothetical protein PCH_Pc22g19010 [Penicillium rubens Wisconsin 54-1255]|uniref:Uncharacterized protein n=1 Tax=Penicillium rubens (strain ATCC 28089 / DSM 1075 / NRRL 1951 / Wisconsin 54-1255) TaxID=500485 RepID=B6HVE5_PENRW|nr:hypothetical protein PCH_Pc22g19010 [Penicillium rubens Wisconsin 54-1255]